MPFPNESILIEFLDTYVKEILEPRLQTIKGQTYDAAARAAGKNNSKITLACYQHLVKLIHQAKSDITLWPKLLVDAGRMAHLTLTTSSFASEFSGCALALRAYFLNLIHHQLATIKDDESLTPDQMLASTIRSEINKRITKTYEYITDLDKHDKLGVELEISSIYTDTLSHDLELHTQNESLSKLKKQKFQRDLVFLGDPNSLKNDIDQNDLIKQLFAGYTFYVNGLDLGASKVSELNLPVVFQPNYDAIYLRIHPLRPHLKPERSDITVVNTFERQVEKRVDESKKQDIARKKSVENEAKNTPSPTDVLPSLPAKSTPRLAELKLEPDFPSPNHPSMLEKSKSTSKSETDKPNELKPNSAAPAPIEPQKIESKTNPSYQTIMNGLDGAKAKAEKTLPAETPEAAKTPPKKKGKNAEKIKPKIPGSSNGESATHSPPSFR